MDNLERLSILTEIKNKNNKLMSFYTDDDDKLLHKYKTIRTKIENLQNIECSLGSIYKNQNKNIWQ